MPLRDHFHTPLADIRSWEELHGQWPAMIVQSLAKILPPDYMAGPRVHLGPYFEIDVASYEADSPVAGGERNVADSGGAATITWAPPQPTFEVATERPGQDEYEVRVYDTTHGRTLVAAVEIVSPANKDRPENRRAFVAKCAALLHQRVSVTIVDLVTIRQFNLYGELVDLIGERDPFLASAPALYAVTCRWIGREKRGRFEAWTHALALGQPLPTLPLWLSEDLAVPLELDATYEETCRILRIT
jgi:hypothetical protein